MHICLIAEGCYPYIVGGVSSWIQSLIKNFPQDQFTIIAINPEQKARGAFKYELPDNVIGVEEIFLDEILNGKGKWNKRVHLSRKESRFLVDLLSGEPVDWPVLYDMFHKKGLKRKFNSVELMLSKKFYSIIQASYGETYTHIPFTEVFWSLRSMFLTLFALVERKYPEADVYHSVSTGYAGIVASCASYLHDKPLVLTEHGIYTREREEELIKSDWVQGYFKDIWIKYFKSLSSSIYASADQVVTLFKKNKEIQIELGCNRKKIQVIHNGIDISKFKSIKKVDKERFLVASIARIVPIKDIKTMIQAFALVNEKIDNVDFLIMGPTDENEEYYQECHDYMTAMDVKNVSFTGRVDIKDYLGKIDVHVLSSISEGQPLTVLETLACKIPNVTTNVGDCEAMIKGIDEDDHYGPAGFVENIMDFKGLARSIVKLLENEDLRVTYGQNGYNRVASRYTFAQFIEGYEAIYNQVEKSR